MVHQFHVFLMVAAILYKSHFGKPSQHSVHSLSRLPSTTRRQPTQNDPILPWELVGLTLLEGPEDVAYHSSSKLIYTGCGDGWIKRVTVNELGVDTVVKKWVNTGGRPLGIAFGHHNEVIVADPQKVFYLFFCYLFIYFFWFLITRIPNLL